MPNEQQPGGIDNENVTYLFGKDVHDQMVASYGYDAPAVTIPADEYESLIEDSAFLEFLEEIGGPEVWETAQRSFQEWLEEEDEEGANDY